MTQLFSECTKMCVGPECADFGAMEEEEEGGGGFRACVGPECADGEDVSVRRVKREALDFGEEDEEEKREMCIGPGSLF